MALRKWRRRLRRTPCGWATPGCFSRPRRKCQTSSTSSWRYTLTPKTSFGSDQITGHLTCPSTSKTRSSATSWLRTWRLTTRKQSQRSNSYMAREHSRRIPWSRMICATKPQIWNMPKTSCTPLTKQTCLSINQLPAPTDNRWKLWNQRRWLISNRRSRWTLHLDRRRCPKLTANSPLTRSSKTRWSLTVSKGSWNKGMSNPLTSLVGWASSVSNRTRK